jgi:hypothetical protein
MLLRGTAELYMLANNMRRLSSKWTFWYKRAFPVFWFGFLALWSLAAIISMFHNSGFPPVILLGPVFMAIFGFLIMKALVFDLVDSAWDDGTEIVIRNAGTEDRILLSNVINVGHSSFTNPPRITLTLREPTRFGIEITFSPPTNWTFWKTHPVAQDLIRRLDENRQKC